MSFLEYTNSLTLQAELFNLTDIVEHQMAQIIFKANNNLLTGNVQIVQLWNSFNVEINVQTQTSYQYRDDV